MDESKEIFPDESGGYIQKRVKKYLMGKGYSKREVEKAIVLEKNGKSGILRRLFKPTILKLFLPILFLILIIISFVINSSYLPEVGDQFCEGTTVIRSKLSLETQFWQIRREQNADSDSVVALLSQIETISQQASEQKFLLQKKYRPLFLGNMYIIPPMIYKLNPFLPIPCELIYYSQQSGNDFRISQSACSYHISEEDYRCITIDLQNQNIPPYKKMNFFIFFSQSLLLAGIIYLLVCFFSFGFNFLIRKSALIKITTAAVFLLLIFSLLLAFSQMVFFISLPFLLLFFVLLFVKNYSFRREILYVAAVILLVLLVVGVIFASYKISPEKTTPLVAYEEIGYKIFPCENTRVLLKEEKENYPFILGDDISEEWNVCRDPSCFDVCDYQCSNKIRRETIILRGENPTCICGCRWE